MKSKVYNQEGKETGTVELPERVFGLPWNGDLVHQVVTSMQANARANTAHTKDRGDVRGGGKKPWRQKGTGRARHGSSRSPIWRGGGVTHGPTNERNYAQKINQKMRRKALLTILAQKQREGEIMFLDKLALTNPKTKLAQTTINNLAQVPGFERLNYRRGQRALLAFPRHDGGLVKSFRNLPGVATLEARNLNPLDAISYRYIVLVGPDHLSWLNQK